MLKAGRPRIRFPMRLLDLFNIPSTLNLTMSWVDSASNRNGYQKSSKGKARPARKAEPNVQKMWDPRRLTTLWAFFSLLAFWSIASFIHSQR
jgi:hypothetical protein